MAGIDLPPRGRDLPFDEFVRIAVAALREMLPEVRATSSRSKATVTHGEATVTIVDADGAIAVRPPGLSIGDRRDAYVARTTARTIAGVLDDRFAADL